jgi:hypothetical protein
MDNDNKKNAHGGYMKIATLGDYLEHERISREWVLKNRPVEEHASHQRRWAEAEERRAGILARFPFNVVCEGSYPEHDVAHRWCWQQFGPVQTNKCYDHYSEYPACPLVLETRELASGSNKDGSQWAEWRYKDPGEHRHEGVWTTFWHGKTGYDYGFSEYCFQSEADRDRFKEIAEKLGLGELYEDDMTKPGCDPNGIPGDGKAI